MSCKNSIILYTYVAFGQIKLKFSLSLRYEPGRFVFEFNKIRMVRHLSFLQTYVRISNFIEPANFILGTNIQHHKVHVMMKVEVILTDA